MKKSCHLVTNKKSLYRNIAEESSWLTISKLYFPARVLKEDILQRFTTAGKLRRNKRNFPQQYKKVHKWYRYRCCAGFSAKLKLGLRLDDSGDSAHGMWGTKAATIYFAGLFAHHSDPETQIQRRFNSVPRASSSDSAATGDWRLATDGEWSEQNITAGKPNTVSSSVRRVQTTVQIN